MTDVYPVTWYKNVIRISKKYVLDLGICGYSEKVAFLDLRVGGKLTDKDLEYIPVPNISITENKCKNSRYCFNFDCPLNEKDLAFFSEYYGIDSEERIRELHSLAEEARTQLNLKPMEEGVLGKFDEPPLYLVGG